MGDFIPHVEAMPESAQGPTESVDEVAFFIPGTPVPQGSKTGYVVGKRAIVTDANAVKLKPWRATVAAFADRGVTFDCPVMISIVFYLPKPQKPRWRTPAVKPDVDKLARAALDGFTDGGLLADDARVVDLHVSKRYPVDGRLGAYVNVSAAVDL